APVTLVRSASCTSDSDVSRAGWWTILSRKLCAVNPIWGGKSWNSPPRRRRGILALARRLHGLSRNPIETALPGKRCRIFLVAAALVAIESMVGSLIDVNLAVGPFLLDDLHVGQRNVRIQRSEMH